MNSPTPQAREAAERLYLRVRTSIGIGEEPSSVWIDDFAIIVQSLLSSRDARITELERALNDVFRMLDEGLLMRINHDTPAWRERVIDVATRLAAHRLLTSPPSPSAVTEDSRIQPKEDER